jgi:hypothetical protein
MDDTFYLHRDTAADWPDLVTDLAGAGVTVVVYDDIDYVLDDALRAAVNAAWEAE